MKILSFTHPNIIVTLFLLWNWKQDIVNNTTLEATQFFKNTFNKNEFTELKNTAPFLGGLFL